MRFTPARAVLLFAFVVGSIAVWTSPYSLSARYVIQAGVLVLFAFFLAIWESNG